MSFNLPSPRSPQRGLRPNEEFFVSKIFTNEGNVLSGRTLRRMEKEFLEREPNKQSTGGFHLHDFSMLCRGEKLPHTKPLTQTQCRLSTMSDPYFILCPLRLEKLSEDPSISIFHDFLSEMEMKSMKHAIMAQMQVSTVQDITVEDGGGIKTSTERTQSSGWLWDEYNPLLYQMSKGSFISFSNQPRRTV